MINDEYNSFRDLLKDWTNRDKYGTRFPLAEAKFSCPICHGRVLEDNWPPNYGGGSSGGKYFKSGYGMKCICPKDRVFFRASYYEEGEYIDNANSRGQKFTHRGVSYDEPVPLVEMEINGVMKLLTPHDVSNEKYKQEHGEYPIESYG